MAEGYISHFGLRTFACALGGAGDNFADRVSRKEAQLFATRVEVGAA